MLSVAFPIEIAMRASRLPFIGLCLQSHRQRISTLIYCSLCDKFPTEVVEKFKKMHTLVVYASLALKPKIISLL